MTRATPITQSSRSNQQILRTNNNFSNTNNRHAFKSSKNRAPLNSISLNNRKNQRKNYNKNNNNPFISYNPCTSGIIAKNDDISDSPSDFSHFLSPTNTPIKNNNNNLNNSISNSSISPIKHNHSKYSNVISSQSQSNGCNNLILKDSNNNNNNNNNNHINIDESIDNFISMGLNNTSNIYQNKMNKINKISNINSNIPNQISLNYIPFDWCLKNNLHFVSNTSLDWCCNISSKIRNAALQNISLTNIQIDSSLAKKQYEFYKNMIYYQYPHNKLTKTELLVIHKFYLQNASTLGVLEKVKSKSSTEFGMITNNNENSGNNGFNYNESIYNKFIDRILEWMESFHSLYSLFRSKFIDNIYISFPNFFNIIFYYNKSKSKSNVNVVITNTHKSFRDNLRKENIKYSTPLCANDDDNKLNNKENICNILNDSDDSDSDQMDIEELQRNGINIRMNKNKNNKTLFGEKYNNSARTVTLIENEINVHNFYDFLLNYINKLCLSHKKCHDVPLLLCNKLFLNSKCGLISMNRNLSGLNENKKRMYTMELNGYILPNTYYNIIKLFMKNKQNTSIISKIAKYNSDNNMYNGLNFCAKSKLFKKLKNDYKRNSTSIHKIELHTKDNTVSVYLQ